VLAGRLHLVGAVVAVVGDAAAGQRQAAVAHRGVVRISGRQWQRDGRAQVAVNDRALSGQLVGQPLQRGRRGRLLLGGGRAGPGAGNGVLEQLRSQQTLFVLQELGTFLQTELGDEPRGRGVGHADSVRSPPRAGLVKRFTTGGLVRVASGVERPA
jgi:hypothetical protein